MWDSNPQPSDWKSDALSIELMHHILMEVLGLEPRKSPVYETGAFNQLSYTSVF